MQLIGNLHSTLVSIKMHEWFPKVNTKLKFTVAIGAR